jgi:hypothetical protein
MSGARVAAVAGLGLIRIAAGDFVWTIEVTGIGSGAGLVSG